MARIRYIDTCVRPTDDGRFLVAPFDRFGPTYLVYAATADRFKRIAQRYLQAYLVVLFVLAAVVGWWFVNHGAKTSDLRLIEVAVVVALAIPFLVVELIYRRMIFRGAKRVAVPGFPPGAIEFMRMSQPRWYLIVLTALETFATLATALVVGYVVLVRAELPHPGLIVGLAFFGFPAYLFFRAAFGRKPGTGTK